MNKRFIAGAVCPRCGEMDRIVAYAKDGEQFRECVSCGFEEKLVAQVAMQELTTRVNQSEEATTPDQEAAQTIKFVSPTKK